MGSRQCWPFRAVLGAMLCLAAAGPLLDHPAAVAAEGDVAPYPASVEIPGMTFRWDTHRRLAPGSDNWPLTWSADDHQYTSFGDGGGFGGSDAEGRVSLGVARVEGGASGFRGVNVWGGADAATSAKFTGKSYGVLAIGTELYMWRCGAGSTDTAFDFQEIHRSSDDARTWHPADWKFGKDLPFYCPTFVQYGKGYSGARDGYVYMHAAERTGGEWDVHKPGSIMLMRAPKDRLMDRGAYQFFAGRDAGGQPRWSAAVADREPVFEDDNGVRLASVAYNPGLRRYLLATEHGTKGAGNIGVFDAPEPWGPWTTVLYADGLGRGHIETSAFYAAFAPKWWDAGGRDFVLVLSGGGQLDSWNSVEGSFLPKGTDGGVGPAGTGHDGEEPLGGTPSASADDGQGPGSAAADRSAAGDTAVAGGSAEAAAPAAALRVMPSGSLASMTYDYLTDQAKEVWDGVRDPRIAAIDTAAEVADHAAAVRAKVLQRIGGLPDAGPGGLNVRVTGTLDRAGYQVDKLIYESQSNFHVTANLYRPKTGTAPFPTVVGIPGHADDAKAYTEYQKVWIALAKRGFIVLTFDPFGQGERFEQWDAARNKPLAGTSGTDEHTIAGTKMYLTGTNPVRWMAHDAMRGIDYLFTRGDVDQGRLAVIGNSGGGDQTNWLAALEPRLDAAGPSCAVNSFEAMWQSKRGLQDAEQNPYGFVGDGLSQADLYAPLAPKPLKIFAATKDYNPIAGTRAAFAEVRTHFYAPLGAPGAVEIFEFKDQHGWTKPRREETVEWLERVLKGGTVNYVEPDPFPTEPPANLRATPGGQVQDGDSGGPGGATTHALNYAIAQSLYAGRAALTTGDLRGLVRSRLEMGSWGGPPPAAPRGTLSGAGYNGYRIEKVALATEGGAPHGITAPALVFVPTGGPAGPRPAVLYLNSAGKAADASDTGPLAKIARSGRIVLAVDARQWGESAAPACVGYDCANHQNAVRALLLDRNLVGMQTRDALRALDYLLARPDVDQANVAVIGKANAGVHALFTAFLDPRVKKVSLVKAPASYLEIAGTQRPGEVMDIVIGKVLADFDLPDLAGALGDRVTRTSAKNPDHVRWLGSSPYPIP